MYKKNSEHNIFNSLKTKEYLTWYQPIMLEWTKKELGFFFKNTLENSKQHIRKLHTLFHSIYFKDHNFLLKNDHLRISKINVSITLSNLSAAYGSCLAISNKIINQETVQKRGNSFNIICKRAYFLGQNIIFFISNACTSCNVGTEGRNNTGVCGILTFDPAQKCYSKVMHRKEVTHSKEIA